MKGGSEDGQKVAPVTCLVFPLFSTTLVFSDLVLVGISSTAPPLPTLCRTQTFLKGKFNLVETDRFKALTLPSLSCNYPFRNWGARKSVKGKGTNQPCSATVQVGSEIHMQYTQVYMSALSL